MKTIKIVAAIATPILIVIIAFGLIGCEDSPDASGLTAEGGAENPITAQSELPGAIDILPDDPQVTHLGQQIEFEARGGHWPYTWSVGEEANGSIQVVQNEAESLRYTAVYTVSAVGHNTVYVRDAAGREGFEFITVGSDTAPTLNVVPDDIDISVPVVGATFDLKAVGGTPPYTWFASDTAIGTISSSSGTSVTYTVQTTDMGVGQTITLTDSGGNYDYCSVDHATPATLTITPSAITVASNFTGDIVFNAAGGTAPYTWSVALPDLEDNGSIAVAGSGNSQGTYTDNDKTGAPGEPAGDGGTFVGDNMVTVIDSQGESAEATITYE